MNSEDVDLGGYSSHTIDVGDMAKFNSMVLGNF